MDRKMRARRNNAEAKAQKERRARARTHSSEKCSCCGKPASEHVAIAFDPKDPLPDEVLKEACQVIMPKSQVN
jgi:hypothetical protein